MRNVTRILGTLLLAGVAFAQAPPAAPDPASPKPPASQVPGPEVPPTAVVLRIPGVCPPAPRSAKGTTIRCETVVTRAEFDRFASVVSPNLSPTQRRTLAQRYAEVLALASRAQREGLDKDVQIQEQLRLARLQILANAYNRSIQKRFENPSDAEIQKYYDENAEKFAEVTLQRLYVPKPVAKEGQPADESTAKALAESLRVRAAAGEGFETLQAEAMKATSGEDQATLPPTSLGPRRRSSLPAGHEHHIFAAPPGQVTPVYEEASGYFVYKVESKRTLPLAEVRNEISNSIASQKISDAMENARKGVTPAFDATYFPAPPEPPAAPPKPPAAPPQENKPPEKTPGE